MGRVFKGNLHENLSYYAKYEDYNDEMLGMFKFNHQVGTDMRMSTMIIKLVCSFPHTLFHIKLVIGMPQDTHIYM